MEDLEKMTMNDFTKEELAAMYWHFTYYLECLKPRFTEGDGAASPKLMKKIKAMIENFCNHKDLCPLYTIKGDIPVGYMCYECSKFMRE